jgi:hypothetical protein
MSAGQTFAEQFLGPNLIARIPLSIQKTGSNGVLTVELSEAVARNALIQLRYGLADDERIIRIRLTDYVSVRPYHSLIKAAEGGEEVAQEKLRLVDMLLNRHDYIRAEAVLKELRQQTNSSAKQPALDGLLDNVRRFVKTHECLKP